MAKPLELLTVPNRAAWRAWLDRHHAASDGIWLVFHKRHTGRTAIPLEDVIRDALAVGWVDSLVKRLDDDRYAIKVTPRKPTSNWSDLNRKRWAELKSAGLLKPAGLAAAPTENRYAARPVIPELPGYIATAFKARSKAWSFFQSLPRRERRNFVVWIHMAKRDETRARRMREAVMRLEAGKKLGLK